MTRSDRDREREQALRRAPRRRRHLAYRSRRASSSPCSGPPAAARRRRCGCSRGSRSRPRAGSCSTASPSTTCRRTSATSTWSSRATRSSTTSTSPTTSPSASSAARSSKEEIARRVAEALELVNLSERASARTNELSGGQRQRVALARALVNRPEVLLLDEPLGALDLKLRRQMQVELKQIQREVGITFVYVTHDQEEALSMSDRIAVMSAGKVVQCGPPEDVYEHPSERVRRRVHRNLEPARGDGRRAPGRCGSRTGSRLR